MLGKPQTSLDGQNRTDEDSLHSFPHNPYTQSDYSVSSCSSISERSQSDYDSVMRLLKRNQVLEDEKQFLEEKLVRQEKELEDLRHEHQKRLEILEHERRVEREESGRKIYNLRRRVGEYAAGVRATFAEIFQQPIDCRNLRRPQIEALNAAKRFVDAGEKRGFISLPTGGGKVSSKHFTRPT